MTTPSAPVQEPRGQSGTLYLVPTPVGPADDLTRRAQETLGRVGVVAAEDTRSARVLLRRHGLAVDRLVSYHDHNERTRAPWLVSQLRDGISVALLPEAGTPLISDPGFRLVRAALDAGVAVMSLAGPSAVTAAVAGSGLATDRFVFIGFLPRQRAKRQAVLAAVGGRSETLVAFEAPHRILEALEDAQRALGDRRCAIAWNLAKAGEQFLRGRLSEVGAEVAGWEFPHGEMTIVIEGVQSTEARIDDATDTAIRILVGYGVPARGVRDALGALVRAPRRMLYDHALAVIREVAGEPPEASQ